MSAPGTPSTPASWYPDPQNPAHGRYWNGTSWTDLLHQPGQPFPVGPELTAPAGTNWNTPWIWLVVVLPVLPSLLLLFVPWGEMFDLANPSSGVLATYGLLLSPFYWGAVALGYLVYGLSVFFAYRDVKELTARGVPRPFHWAFAFISGVVYAIGRSVVVHRRTGDGHQPIWAEVAVLLVSVGVMIAILVMVFAGMTQFLETTLTR